MSTWVHPFTSTDVPTDRAARKALLGGKGSGLTEMTAMGLPVPPGFTLTTHACVWFFEHGESWPAGADGDLAAQIEAALADLESRTGKRLGDPSRPLLVSVRSGAPVSMPGMMDTVLNLGLNDTTVAALAVGTGRPRFAWDSYRRFVEMFGDVVLGIHYTQFSRATADFSRQHCQGVEPSEMTAEQLEALTGHLRDVIARHGLAFPQDPREQLKLAINAVFRSYNSHRARYYRQTHGIPDDTGTAVNVQAMVFGNMGEGSGTGVCFTRNPKTGDAGLFGEWLPDAQGEDVVAGTRTPFPINAASRREDDAGDPADALERALPDAYAQLAHMAQQLERHFRDMQDIEFTIESGQLFLLQTRTGKRSGQAAVQIVVDLVQEGVIDRDDALRRIDPRELESVLRPVLSPDARRSVIAKGLDASPGAACGRVVFTAQEAQDFFDRDEPTILVRIETSPEDIQGMTLSQGILTSRGGQTSHAAVVARGMGKPCVVGCTQIHVDYSRELFYAGDSVVRKGDWITIDGATGEVMEGKVAMLAPRTDAGSMATLLSWADEKARLKVRANADTGGDATRARSLGAVGIGLCRTEHMFFQPDALRAMRRMILADEPRSRQRALQDILPIQRAMFRDIFQAMDGLPVTIRLLDPPLHEFLPGRHEDLSHVSQELEVPPEKLRARLIELAETNPMLGHRGVRVGVTTPDVYRTQVRAIFEAACELCREGVMVVPEVMIPLVALPAELDRMRKLVVECAEKVLDEYGVRLRYLVGTMIELPRAAVLAQSIAQYADFFSFGTNDLTQMVWGLSRDDMGKFIPEYQRQGIVADAPTSVFDVEGVGPLVEMGCVRGRAGNQGLKLGVCGEHGGDPRGIGFFHKIGLDYVSCSPYRVPVARLAAAHAAMGIL
jgi:pyruvate,orthophosphate dikinase